MVKQPACTPAHPPLQLGATRMRVGGARHSALRVALGLSLAIGTQAAAGPARPSAMDLELMTDLLQWASRFSGLPLVPDLPGLRALPAAELARQVCPRQPSDCRTLIAVYDTDLRQVLYLDSLDLRDETDQSFIVHELVHYLQHMRDAELVFASCERVMAAETVAYSAQNRYLAHFKQWRRVGEMLRFTHCHSASAEPEYRPDAQPALTSRSPLGH